MTEASASSALSISRHTPGSIGLLQIHVAEDSVASQCATRLLGACNPGSSPISGPRAFAVGPTEWILVDFPLIELRRRAATGLARLLWRITDITGALVSLSVVGQEAATVLLADIGAPGLPTAARPGQFARTRLGQVDVLLQCITSSQFEVLVDRSVASWLEAWLAAQRPARA